MNDRQLRFIVDGLGGKSNGMPREDGFDITVASEVMAILCLAKDLTDLKDKLRRIVVGYSWADRPVTAGELKAEGAMAALLKDALKPNLAQTLEHTPAFVHGGPFANIAHGCNSIMATGIALKLADYVITEAGFGADLGAEKFFNIKCRTAGFQPAATVIVATVRALKHHGGVAKQELSIENLESLRKGLPNLLKHLENITIKFGLPAVVAINRFPTDTEAELQLITAKCKELGANVVLSEVWSKGGQGGLDLAGEIIRLTGSTTGRWKCTYPDELPIQQKIESITREIYGGAGVDYDTAALKEIERLEANGFGNLPVCMAKTQYSFSDDPRKLGQPQNFRIKVRNVKVAAGAGFIIAITGEIMTMPGLPKNPAAEKIDVDSNGKISGLF